MNLSVEQSCPQCGGSVILSDSDHLLTCPYCATRLYLQTSGVYRYVLPALRKGDVEDRDMVYAPYLHFKGTIFLISDSGISYKAVDTTQLGVMAPGLPPSLGVRPQAMKLRRLTPETGGRYLPLSFKARAIFEKAAVISELTAKDGSAMYHRAFVGEAVNFIYLPLMRDESDLLDGVTGTRIMDATAFQEPLGHAVDFNDRWQVRFLPTLCPRCGWTLDGEGDCLVVCCSNCHTAWEITGKGLQQVPWEVVPGNGQTRLYLPFWKVSAHLPFLDMYSFADFIVGTNQPMIPRPAWRERKMCFHVPAFKLRPKNFLQLAKQMTLAQWRLEPQQGFYGPNRFPVTLTSGEARQSIKVCLAESTSTRRRIYTGLPMLRLKEVAISLLYVPFTDQYHDWHQPQTLAVVPKNILRFGRSM